ncbi:MAG: 4Fe-4S binding protein [Bacteroidetes bacterium]|nr:4Fe-4S binding protein [Bacteroidota bacterium]
MYTRRYVLTFPPDKVNEPLTYHLIKDFRMEINILKADINAGKEGKLLLEFRAEKIEMERGLKYINKKGVGIAPVSTQISLQLENCVHCGACTAVCFTNALTMEKPSWELNFKTEKCIVCGLCLKACPLNLFKMEF